MGPFYLVDLTIDVRPHMTVMEAHALEARVRHTLKHEIQGIREVSIHVHPANTPESDDYHGCQNHGRDTQDDT